MKEEPENLAIYSKGIGGGMMNAQPLLQCSVCSKSGHTTEYASMLLASLLANLKTKIGEGISTREKERPKKEIFSQCGTRVNQTAQNLQLMCKGVK